MDCELIDSSGTDDDLPQSQYNRAPAGSIIGGNGRSSISSASFQRMYVDMEVQIHNLEQEAYGAVLRAFKAQSDALTWEKESLITELRKELRVSDDEHRDLLTKVNADNLIHRIREWRKTMGNQPVHDQLPSPTVSGSRKRPKMSQSVIMPLGAPLESLHHQTIAANTQPTTPGAKWGAAPGNGGLRSRAGQPVFSSSKPVHYQQAGPGSSSALHSGELAERPRDPLIGRRVMTRWPDDNNFYEAIITDYSAIDGRHALVYDINTPNETWEWVDLKEIRSVDIRWIGDDPGISRVGGGGGTGYGVNTAGRGRRFARQQFENDVNASENRIVQKTSDEIEILHTETLLKKVEKVIDASHPDLVEIEKAKKMLKEHEQALIDVIAKLADVCGSGSGGEQPLFRKNNLLVSNLDGGADMEPNMRARGQGTLENHPDEDVIII
ncbi:Protein EMSY-LIKE 3 [Capsicum annuum]|uniref:Protein EMSY-LIKE 3 n=1 Tax=Capsicum annuum TaxID=4072 RepID=A0A1U8G2K2_CAPAN|nr:protein EMSY-LIKE 3 isoform X2 [Capsicum annuum]KAF3640810.1 Protein EMSY-LIKE 3 [Capsicum annuum]KAF3641020.1 Protein EMSY-LIKE 3 [Capsicum annuum]PHT86644.1 Protein EMSY-LIKE 3 [Capsicum annuum]